MYFTLFFTKFKSNFGHLYFFRWGDPVQLFRGLLSGPWSTSIDEFPDSWVRLWTITWI